MNFIIIIIYYGLKIDLTVCCANKKYDIVYN